MLVGNDVPPVLILAFNRLDCLIDVMAQVAKVQPQRIFLAADGPRINRPGEFEQCNKVREYLLSSISWPCEVKSLFRDTNLGCGKAVSSAITWFFSEVEEGIILEDDCVPDISFFSYAEKLLTKFRNNSRIMHISGNNPLGNTQVGYTSYYFSPFQHCWGWASWRRAWALYRFELEDSNFQSQQIINNMFPSRAEQATWFSIFNLVKNHGVDTWDYQWTWAIFKNQGLCCTPCGNLVSNIGFDGTGTHTFDADSSLAAQKVYPLAELRHPNSTKTPRKIVTEINRRVYSVLPPAPLRAMNKLLRLLGVRR